MAIEVLLGDEAIGLGAIHAGISGAYAYPGTPSTEIFEFIERRTGDEVHTRWSPNEKVAYEEALGMSWAGKRATVSMKHVGLNVAADAFVNSAITGVGGGLAVIVADDPSMHSSQNEQDTRRLARFALVPCLEPRDQQQGYDMMAAALDLSERFNVPVVVRLVTRLAHSRAPVRTTDQRAYNELKLPEDTRQWTLLPSNARVSYRRLLNRLPEIAEWAEQSEFNPLALRGRTLGVISTGLGANYVDENLPDGHEVSTLHIGAYPIPRNRLKALVEHVDRVLVVEEGSPFVEELLTGLYGLPDGKRVSGRLDGTLPRDGELTPDNVRAALGLGAHPAAVPAALAGLPNRPPALCQGCPHDAFYAALNEALGDHPGAQVLSDIGCYTLGALPPRRAIHSCVCMGASVGMALGAAHAGAFPVCSVIGDSTFGHSGIPGLLVAAQEDTNVVICILDNDYVAMTGGQPSASAGDTLDRMLVGLGVDPAHIRMVMPIRKRHAETVQTLREEIAHPGLSVIVSRRPCIQKKPAKRAKRTGK